MSDEEREMINCGHPQGCRCERVPLTKVACGNDTTIMSLAAMKVREGRWFTGAPSHVFADLLSELDRLGYVLARKER